ncbi:MAG: hypothetical protein ACRETD_14755, partial [Steroidobacteraceae bacterium]
MMRYVAASKHGRGPLIAAAANVPNMVVAKEAALPLEYGVHGTELDRALAHGCEIFIRDMELQGLT